MQSIPNTPQATPAPARNADPLKQHACVVLHVRFIDGNKRPFYSRDIDYKNQWQYGNERYWVQRFKKMVEEETPKGWSGRVDEAAIFYNFDGNRGDKICQFIKDKGGWQQ
ncbi:hypothetical protein [Spirosoma oryzicola]|uniref:hypothetical protein n=1 Tax=Spirosoma oryzicola TaxID=2898794 RepID=UPI001E441FC3|nr:hypothetical protein [Spirosoma oryzicola]UHG93351.1 hypothetical protein LQ777_10705 [Spirosoma oryzicola]